VIETSTDIPESVTLTPAATTTALSFVLEGGEAEVTREQAVEDWIDWICSEEYTQWKVNHSSDDPRGELSTYLLSIGIDPQVTVPTTSDILHATTQDDHGLAQFDVSEVSAEVSSRVDVPDITTLSVLPLLPEGGVALTVDAGPEIAQTTFFDAGNRPKERVKTSRARRFCRGAASVVGKAALAGTAFAALFIGTTFVSAEIGSHGKDSGIEALPPGIEPATTLITTTTELLPAIDTIVSTTIDTTSTTIEQPTINPNSITDGVLSGRTTLLENIGQPSIGVLSAPGMCLDDISIAVANTGLYYEFIPGADVLVSQLPEDEQHQAIADLMQEFDPTYGVYPDPTPQKPCLINTDSPRWEQPTKGSHAAVRYATPAEILPIADLSPLGVLPGEEGNAVISAHATTEGAAFNDLDTLQQGDIVTYTADNGVSINFSVVSTDEKVPPTESGLNQILNYTNPMGKKTLTLYTCDDNGTTRLVVRLVAI
jgi:LPXTG-site transpeptidase (sortase) family protein